MQELFAQETINSGKNSRLALAAEAYEKGDFRSAADLWFAEASLGSADAQFKIGVLYAEGDGYRIDRDGAIFWMQKAAKQGHAESQFYLGRLLLQDQDDPVKRKEGFDWWRKSADNGLTIAQYHYGRALFFGNGLKTNRSNARVWIERAVKGGSVSAVGFLQKYRDSFSASTDKINAVSEQHRVTVTTQPITNDTDQINSELENSAIGETDNRVDYVAVKHSPAWVRSRIKLRSPKITRINRSVLLRVIERVEGWLRVEVPGGVPGWVLSDEIEVNQKMAEVVSDYAIVLADPTTYSVRNEMGKLSHGTRVLFLEQRGGWARVQLPERFSGWIEEQSVVAVKESSEEIAKRWKIQQIEFNPTVQKAK